MGIYEVNQIYNEDSYKAIKNIPDNSIDCIYTDIPYFYVKGGIGNSELAKRITNKKRDIKNISDGIDYNIFDEFKRVMKKTNIFIWCSKMQIHDILDYWDDDNINFEILTWNKTNPQPSCNNVWLPDIEYCLYFREAGVKLNDGYDFKSKWYTSAINKSDKDLYEHPTIKPLELVKRHLLHATQENDIVADFFSGSGTTCVASKEINRRFIGFEIDEYWYQKSIDRLNGVTAQDRKALDLGQVSIFDI